MTRKQRVTRVVYGIYVVVVAAFVISNIWQIGATVFGTREGAAAKPAVTVGEACGKAIDEDVRAIERARTAASTEASADAARKRYARERAQARPPEVENACTGEPYGADALAALARFDRAAVSHAVRTASELSPVRLSSQSFISGHPQ